MRPASIPMTYLDASASARSVQRLCALVCFSLLAHLSLAEALQPPPAQTHTGDINARDLIAKTIEHWRGTSSYGETTMRIHRPDWERVMAMKVWTKGNKHSLVRILQPKKDQGNGTLLIDQKMWIYSPKVNRIIKIPSSMMSQSWMGSDFSNKDVAKTDEIIDQFHHTLLETEEQGDHKVYLIESIPKEDAATVWGKKELLIRSDHLLLEERYFDQDNRLVKTLKTLNITYQQGRSIAQHQRMINHESPDEWTEIEVSEVTFDVALSDSIFTLSNLRNPR